MTTNPFTVARDAVEIRAQFNEGEAKRYCGLAALHRGETHDTYTERAERWRIRAQEARGIGLILSAIIDTHNQNK